MDFVTNEFTNKIKTRLQLFPFYRENESLILILSTLSLAFIAWFITKPRKKKARNNQRNELLEYFENYVENKIKVTLSDESYLLQSFSVYKKTANNRYVYYPPPPRPPGSKHLTADVDMIYKDYVNNNERLLITGEAGAGKSSVLVRVWRNLIKDARLDVTAGIPVFINAATWEYNLSNSSKDYKKTFINWAAQQIKDILSDVNIEESFIRNELQNGKVILLLDGLDESAYSRYFITCLNAYLQNRDGNPNNFITDVIMCCRSEKFDDYFAGYLENVHIANYVIKFNPIDDPLKSIAPLEVNSRSHPVFYLKQSLEKHTHIRGLLHSAFRIKMALALSKNQKRKIDFGAIRSDNDLIDAYIRNEVDKVTVSKPYKTVKYLAQLSLIEDGLHPTNGFNILDCMSLSAGQEIRVGLIRCLVTFIFGLLIGVGLYLSFYPLFSLAGPYTIQPHWWTLGKPIVLNAMSFIGTVAFLSLLLTFYEENYFHRLRDWIFPRMNLSDYIIILFFYVTVLPFVWNIQKNPIAAISTAVILFFYVISGNKKEGTLGSLRSDHHLWIIFSRAIVYSLIRGFAIAFYISMVLFSFCTIMERTNTFPFLELGRLYTLYPRPGYFPTISVLTTGLQIAALIFMNMYVYSFFYRCMSLVFTGKMPVRLFVFLANLDENTDLIHFENGNWKFTHSLLKERLQQYLPADNCQAIDR
ncbi:hypothetical protein GGD38_004517 [Chitinophagaceae bacterium OAS944]|uniref:NACHT domain-containing protein n=1 Tax=Niastella sp. OAS944 TaxID=2664089 RepID=UPI0035C7C417|nr:hypothetical protein [Chitinophagaceae bacterium OAS944]